MTETKRIQQVVLAVSFVLMSSVSVSTVYSDIMRQHSASPRLLLDFLTVVPGPVSILAMLAGGILQRKFNTKHLFSVSLLLVLLAGLMPLVLDSIWPLILSRALIAFGLGVLTQLTTIILARTFEGNTLKRLLGFRNAFQAIGSMAFILFSLFLSMYGWQKAFLIYLFAAIPLYVVLRQMPRDFSIPLQPQDKPGKTSSSLLQARVLYITGMSFVYYVCLNTLAPSLSSFLVENNLSASSMSGFALCSYMLGSFLSGMQYHRLTRLLGKYTFFSSLLITALGILMITVSRSLATVIIASMLQGLGVSVFNASSILIAIQASPDQHQPTVIRLILLSNSFGSFMSPFIVDFLQQVFFHSVSMRGRFAIASIVLLGFSLLSLFVHYSTKENAKNPG